ncbi:hypothetical protein [Halioxenophilus sp. WMMB6]|uniref:hypothetical protein n=1 Tax=Halioxenophilus sp. WMMB6 TaxID=3073815 RepID=UPI00295E8149|nr:hypothetical protein [Halioxenophilus sp. WMMB6]
MADTIATLEINDQGIRLNHPEETRVSPAYALFEGQWLTLGEDAQSQFRLRPLASNNQFWNQLSLEPLANASALIKHPADLVYHQLRALFDGLGSNNLLIVLPGYFSDEQLSLLLGICQSLQQQVCGLVDAALVGSSAMADGRYLHLDMHLHQSVLSSIDIHDRQASKVHSALIAGCGRAQLNDAWVRAISDEFIRQTRFNPRHVAEHEQTLYNQLDEWQRALLAGETKLTVADYSITTGFATLQQASRRFLEPLLEAISEQSGRRLLLSHQAAALQSLDKRFAGGQLLGADTVSEQCQHLLPQLVVDDPDEGVAFAEHLILPAHHATPAAEKHAPATHVLLGNSAYAITELWLDAEQPGASSQPPADSLCRLERHQDRTLLSHSSPDCTLNGEPAVAGTELQAGDRLANAQLEYRLIQVH